VTCGFTKVSVQSPTTPVIVIIQGHPATIAAGTVNRIRLVKIKNPPDKVAYVNSEPIMIHFTVYTFDTLFSDKYHLNRTTLYRVYDVNEL
jgi:hypothetical protein